MTSRKQTPNDFLKQIIGRPVVVKLNSGVDYRGNLVSMTLIEFQQNLNYYRWIFFCFFTGVLACLDGYLNIALEQTEEYVNGQLKQKYGDAFIRGNNGLFLFFMFNN